MGHLISFRCPSAPLGWQRRDSFKTRFLPSVCWKHPKTAKEGCIWTEHLPYSPEFRIHGEGYSPHFLPGPRWSRMVFAWGFADEYISSGIECMFPVDRFSGILLYFSNNLTMPHTRESLCRHALKEIQLPLLVTTWCPLKEFIEPCVPRCILVD